jgi:hypothetical protein
MTIAHTGKLLHICGLIAFSGLKKSGNGRTGGGDDMARLLILNKSNHEKVC